MPIQHYQTVKPEFVIKVPYKKLMKLIGVPTGAIVTHIEGDKTNGLIVWYEK